MDEPIRTESVRIEVERALASAIGLTDTDAGAVAVLRVLADKIDQEADLRFAFIAWSKDQGLETPRVPKEDNVSIPTFLKYCNELGLTPAARAARAGKKQEDDGGQPKSGLAARRRAASHLRTA